MCWVCCWSGSCTVLHRDGVVHAQWCWPKGHQPSPVRLDGEAFSTCWAHCSVLTGGQGHRCGLLTSWHARVTLSVQQRAVAGLQQMCHQKQEFLPWAWAFEVDSSEPTASPQRTMHGQPLWQGEPCGCSPCCTPKCAQYTRDCSALQGATICCGCFQVWCSLLLVRTHLPSLLPGKGESLTNLVFKATMAAACDCLVGQAVGTSRESIWSSLQLPDKILLL